MYIPQVIWVFGSIQVFGILAVIFVLCAALKLPVFNFPDQNLDFFKWHQVLMCLSVVYLMGSSITMYRGLSFLRIFHLRIIHGSIQFAVIVFAIAGVVLEFQIHSNLNMANLISLHSIFGLITVILLVLQWVSGFVIYLYPKTSLRIQTLSQPGHMMSGMVIFFLGAVTALTGLNGVSLNSGISGVLYKCGSFCTFIFAVLIFYLVAREKFRREPLSDEEEEDKA